MTADNSFELWVNGRKAGKGDNFHVASGLDVRRMLRPGTNMLAVAAENGGATPNPAGLIGVLVAKFSDGRSLTLPTDRTWLTSQTARGKWTTSAPAAEDGSAALELGPLGMAPWGAVQMPTVEPDVFCDFAVVTGLLGKLGVPPDFDS